MTQEALMKLCNIKCNEMVRDFFAVESDGEYNLCIWRNGNFLNKFGVSVISLQVSSNDVVFTDIAEVEGFKNLMSVIDQRMKEVLEKNITVIKEGWKSA